VNLIEPKHWKLNARLSPALSFQCFGSIKLTSKRWQLRSRLVVLGICTAMVLLLTHGWIGLPSQAQLPSPSSSPSSQRPPETLPLPAVHPLPTTLAAWQDVDELGDYFSAIQPTPIGYLVWSQFPVRVYVEPALPNPTADGEGIKERSQQWVEAVTAAVQEWSVYLPLQLVGNQAAADITIWRRLPPLLREGNRPPRARSAETRYELYSYPLDQSSKRLSHRMTILLRPDQTSAYTRAAARHELGHALGIWGHSPVQTDALYFSQVRTPPSISNRDINTLKRIYEQPTRLGFSF
jgi:predicted Zn-dependent protease